MDFQTFIQRQSDSVIYVGIDPGAEGAIGFISGTRSAVVDIPTLKVKRGKGKKTTFDYPAIVRLFRPLNEFRELVQVVLEVPPPSMGPKTSAYAQFRLGCAYAMWPLFLIQKGFAIEETQPSVWKREMKLSTDKETSRHIAMKRFPLLPLSLKKHHNRAEAILLAEWLRRKHNGEKV